MTPLDAYADYLIVAPLILFGTLASPTGVMSWTVADEAKKVLHKWDVDKGNR